MYYVISYKKVIPKNISVAAVIVKIVKILNENYTINIYNK